MSDPMSPDDGEKQRLELASRLRESREYLGLSQEEVANVLGLSRTAITNLESGTRRVEAVELDKLARLYGKTADYLLTGQSLSGAEGEHLSFLARATQGLSERDVEEIGRFADFLRNSSMQSKKGK